MNNWIRSNRLILAGGILGGLAGFIYWRYVGCITGTCAITSNPLRSTLYFAIVGGLLFSLFKKSKKPEEG